MDEKERYNSEDSNNNTSVDSTESTDITDNSAVVDSTDTTDTTDTVEEVDQQSESKEFEKTYQDQPETYVTPEGEPTSIPTVAPVPAAPMGSGKRGMKNWIVGGLVVLLLAGLSAFAFWQYAEAENNKAEVDSLQKTLSALQAGKNTDKPSDDNAVTESPITNELSTNDKITISVNEYVCNLSVETFVCDSAVTAVTKVQEFKAGKAGYAIATAEGTDKVKTNLYLKTHNGNSWIVIWEGSSKPPADIVKKFEIPADF